MSDELDRLRAGLKAAPPAADPAAKAGALRRAMENFDSHQETAKATRPMSDRPGRAGLLTGVRLMLSTLTTRGGLAATASIAAIGVAITLWPSLQDRGRMGEPAIPIVVATAPGKDESSERPAEGSAPTEALAEAAPLPSQDMQDAAEAPAVEQLAAEQSSLTLAAPAPAAEPASTARRAIGNASEPGVYAGIASGGAVGDLARAAPPAASMSDSAGHPEIAPLPEPDTEAYSGEAPNPVKIVAEDPVSTFSIDTDTASWSVIRSSLTNGQLPPKQAVRIEEMVNYFPYDYPAPEPGEAPFRASVSLFPTPWNADTQLLRIGLQGAMPATDNRPPLNLVFLIDTSGSMDDPKKLPLLKQSFALMLGELRPEDRVAIVTYAGSAGLVLEPTEASDRATILAALDRLGAGGSTAGQEGLRQAYQVAESMGGEGHVSRILLATDGDFNVGIADPGELKDFIATKRESGTYLSVLGFGRGNLDDAVMQALAQNGNGTAAYIDTLSEAQKVLVDQLTGALFPIADDVKIQIEFNPAAVAEYRLIGYETRALAREDFNNDRVDAGEIGAGHQVTALYEITPAGSPARLSDPLRYAAGKAPEAHPAELGFLKLRHKAPGTGTSTLTEVPIPLTPGAADPDARFAAAIAGMGQLLSEPKYLGDWGWDEAIALAGGARGADEFGYRAEAVQLIRLARSLDR
ncbi:MAG: VWA domain-containing protein [Rhodobacteraceae bacterium]|nr:VWA domain-containing protein [Paracoccaceae bacterium]